MLTSGDTCIVANTKATQKFILQLLYNKLTDITTAKDYRTSFSIFCGLSVAYLLLVVDDSYNLACRMHQCVQKKTAAIL